MATRPAQSNSPASRAGPGALVAVMVVGSLTLWIGMPLLWLWIGSQLQESQGNGTAIMITFFGAIGSIIALAIALGWVGHRHTEMREARGEPRREHSVLGTILVATAGIAVSAFSIWFIFFAGANFAPLQAT
jgi:hypothetical protein